MRTCVTGATGFVGGHLTRELIERGHDVRVTYRDAARLERLRGFDPEPVRADILDRAAMRRAVRGCDVVFHTAGIVASKPVSYVQDINALAPRIAVEAAAAEGVPRVVVTSSVAGIGPVPRGQVGREEDLYRGGGLGLTYPDAKHEGEMEAFAAGARLGVEVVVTNPAYVLGVPLDRRQPGETSTRIIGNYLRGRLPAVVDGGTTIVDVRDVADGHLLAAERGKSGERYVLGGHNTSWPELMAKVARLAGVDYPLAVFPHGVGALARRAEALRLPLAISAEAMVLMEQNWCYSSAKAKRELGYRPRSHDSTVRATVDWYRELIDAGVLDGGSRSPLSLGAAGLRLADRVGALAVVDALGRRTGHRLVAR
ncbi:MAG TPA: NAD-dependent epimerase/dehydratase family protein [Thermoleophilaceae bacterium]|nr:NAD-dependent epimerase/dehydratase family protein [Thermoleophilaceae bacterium]